MANALVLAIDQGTTNTKAALVDEKGTIVVQASAPVPIYHPQSGWVEQDADEIWQSVLEACSACINGYEKAIVAIGISNQRESVVAWNAKTAKPAGPCVTWQCRRGTDICERAAETADEAMVSRKTGLLLDPMFSASKASWLAANADCAAEDLRIGTVDSWLLFKLSDGKQHACDESNASRTLLFDIEKGRWDEQLCEMFSVSVTSLPEARASDSEFGVVANAKPLPDGIPIRGLIGDSHAALFGHGITQPGIVKATYGTGSSLMTLLSSESKAGAGIAKTIAWNVDGKRVAAQEGNILVSASALPWAANLIGLGGDPAKLAALAETVQDSAGVHFVPALVGLGAPYWDARARGLFTGLSFNTGQAQLARAVMESVAWQVCDVFTAMNEAAEQPLQSLHADGGPSENSWLMQLQADFMGCNVLQCSAPSVSALGAAGIAGIGHGVWRDADEFAALKRDRRELQPRLSQEQRLPMHQAWKAAVARAQDKGLN